MDTATLKKLLHRAADCLDSALLSASDDHPSNVDMPIKTALEILSYIQTKRALSGDLAPSVSPYVHRVTSPKAQPSTPAAHASH